MRQEFITEVKKSTVEGSPIQKSSDDLDIEEQQTIVKVVRDADVMDGQTEVNDAILCVLYI